MIRACMLATSFLLAGAPGSAAVDETKPLIADPSIITWLGVTLGQPAASLRATLGDPLNLTRFPEDLPGPAPAGAVPQRKARYWINSGVAYLIVTEIGGRVEEIEAFQDGLTAPADMPADPFGNVLGATLDPIAKVHPAFVREARDGDTYLTDRATHPGVEVVYQFSPGTLRAIRWIDHRERPAPALPALTARSGLSPQTAIRNGETLDAKSVDWEYAYLRFHRCDGDTGWKVTGQRLLTATVPMDEIHVSCPTTHVERDFFFDISGSFGHS